MLSNMPSRAYDKIETKWSSEIAEILRRDYGVWVLNNQMNRRQAGFPDKTIFCPGDIVLNLEFKGPETKISPLQKATMDELEKRTPLRQLIVRRHSGVSGGEIYFWDCPGDIRIFKDKKEFYPTLKQFVLDRWAAYTGAGKYLKSDDASQQVEE